MKWKNKGKEYDEVYINIKNKRGFYLFGAGNDGNMVYKILTQKLGFGKKLLGYIDNDKNKQGKIINGLRVYSFDEINIKEDEGVIISIASEILKPLTKSLDTLNLRKNIDYFHYYEFISVVAVYEQNKIFLPSVSFLVIEQCNLNCRACLNFSPYIKNYNNKTYEQLKDDVDTFFKIVDFVNIFHLTGGEPMLYKDLPRLIEYIHTNYKDKIFSLETVTNGTVMPSDEFIEVYKKCEIKLTIDDYIDAVPQYKEKFEKIVGKFKDIKSKSSYVVKKYDTWIDLAPFRKIDDELNEKQLIEKYDACHVPWSEYNNKKLSMCNYASFAKTAQLVCEFDEEYLDFSSFSYDRKKELVEFRLGYSDKGYTEFCKKCAGYIEINPYKVTPALQMSRGENRNG